MYFQYFIILLFILCFGTLLWFFQNNKNKETKKHGQRMATLNYSLELNKQQIAVRKMNMDRYNFMMQNIEDALVFQPQIKLNTR